MALFTIGDPHLSLGANKPMDVFGGWKDYVPRLEASWQRLVAPEDTVVLAGDISWAMKLEECDTDFAFLNRLPGQKILLKGNHDYWWSTMAKMTRYLEDKGFTTLKILFNNSYLVDGVALCGTRSWLFEAGQPHDTKVMQREIGRLRASLQSAKDAWPDAERIVFLHYPPLYSGACSPEIVELMQEYNVKRCFYGHLHSGSIKWAVQGEVEGIRYKLVSADSLGFTPYPIPL